MRPAETEEDRPSIRDRGDSFRLRHRHARGWQGHKSQTATCGASSACAARGGPVAPGEQLQREGERIGRPRRVCVCASPRRPCGLLAARLPSLLRSAAVAKQGPCMSGCPSPVAQRARARVLAAQGAGGARELSLGGACIGGGERGGVWLQSLRLAPTQPHTSGTTVSITAQVCKPSCMWPNAERPTPTCTSSSGALTRAQRQRQQRGAERGARVSGLRVSFSAPLKLPSSFH